MKNKAAAIVLAALLIAGASACLQSGSGSGSSASAASSQASSAADSEPQSAPSEQESEPAASEAATDDKVDGILKAIRDAYGEDYLPGGDIPQEILESEFSLTPDMYTLAKGEMAMISAHPDRVVVVHAAPDKADAVEAALNTARDAKIADTLQYPANVPKTNASVVVRNGDYLAFLLVGAPWEGNNPAEAELPRHFQQEIQKGVDAFNASF